PDPAGVFGRRGAPTPTLACRPSWGVRLRALRAAARLFFTRHSPSSVAPPSTPTLPLVLLPGRPAHCRQRPGSHTVAGADPSAGAGWDGPRARGPPAPAVYRLPLRG